MKKTAGLFFAIVMFVILMSLTAVTTYATMAPGVITRVYEDNKVIYEKEDKWDIVFSEIKEKCESEWIDKKSLKCVIDIERDCTIDSLANCNYLPMPLTINLHGHLLELDHGDYWEFDHDLAINGDGGKITTNRAGDQYNCSFWMESGYLNVNGTTIENMKTNMKYPVFALSDGCGDAVFSNCTFTGCSSTKYGGAICMEKTHQLYIYGCTFDDCAAYYGGAVYAENIVNDSSDAITIHNTDFVSCSAYYGGAVYIEDTSAWDYNLPLKKANIRNSSVKDCVAKYDGGGIYCDCTNGNLYADLEMSHCIAGRYGGGFYLAGESNYLGHAQISLCHAKYGGGIYCGDINLKIKSTRIHDCEATKEGGAYYTDYPSGDYKTIIYPSNNFYSNSPSDGNSASVLSEGSLAVIVGIAALVLGLAGGFLVGKAAGKKKKPAVAGDAENTEE